VTGALPRIGITTGGGYDIAEYETAVRAAGGEAVRLDSSAAHGPGVPAGLDGIIFSGGDDIDPARYGQTPHARTEAPIAERDTFELALVRAAFERALPVLAICRGLQVVNVAFGGTLHQHVPDTYGFQVPHQPQVNGRTFRGLIDAHRIAIDAPSQLATLAGSSIVTGSRHHQAVDRIAAPFRATAHASDGVIEALEPIDPSAFFLAVQWHPESTVGIDDGTSAALFAALIRAAKGERVGGG
jgi:putative glutamine amidotransferase